MPDPLPIPERALAIGAHPDDIEFGAGGTLANWAAAGTEVTLLILTDGSKGTWDRSLPPADLVAIRRREQAAAGAALGAANVIMLDHADGELEYSMALRSEVARQIRLVEPEVVLSHDPWRPYELHPDHRATGWSAVDGVVAARDHLFFPEHDLEPHRPTWLLLWWALTPDHWEDISTSFTRKLEALYCHESQALSSMGTQLTPNTKPAFEQRMRAWAAEQGQPAGLQLAEAFKKLSP